MQRGTLLKSCLALATPAALGILLVGAPFFPFRPDSAQRVTVAATPSLPHFSSSSTPIPNFTGPIEGVIGPAKPVLPELPAASAPSIAPEPARWKAPPSPTPQPTAVSDARFDRANQLASEGETTETRALLTQIATSSDRPTAAHARFLLARLWLLNHDDAGGIQGLQDYLRNDSGEADATSARLALALALSDSGRSADALSLFQQYLAETTDHTLDGYAWLALARDAESRRASEALDDYRRAVQAGLPAPDEADAAAKVGATLITQGRASEAVDWYLTLANRYAADDPVHSRYLARAATVAARGGQSSLAASLIRQFQETGLATADSVAELAALRGLGYQLDSLSLGGALLKAGRFSEAIAALGDYIDAHPDGPDLATARFERGQALLGDGDNSSAASQFQKFLDAHPNDPRVPQAKDLLARAQSGTALAADGIPPSAVTAPPRQSFDQGWTAYEALDFASARQNWSAVLQRWPTNPGSSEALLWLGKLDLHDGDTAAALRDLTLAWNANPGDFYAFRARELAGALNPAAIPPTRATADPVRERSDFESWLASWANPPAGAAIQPYLGAPVARTSTLSRIRALAALGASNELDREYRAASNLYWSDPRSLYALADVLSQVGLSASSMKLAYHLLMISPASNAYQSPLFLQRLVYPFPYRDTIQGAARQHGIDPLLLVALIRQESSFDPAAHSPAGALGLTQIMPSTAETLASSLGMGGFADDDVLRPGVAIDLGAAYLAGLEREYGGNAYLALAAYNAGSGNLNEWLGDNPRRDFDLLAQEIPFQETRDYVRNVYRFYQEYQLLYGGDAR